MTRRDFMVYSTVGLLELTAMRTKAETNAPKKIMPVMFIGHGSPMNAVQNNGFTQALSKAPEKLPRPAAILAISAHWMSSGKTMVSSTATPETIYDFGGFPDELYKIKYDAKGSPDFAEAAIAAVKALKISADNKRGLDHGAWTVLKHMYPKADIPVFQLSIDMSKPPQFHYDLGKELLSLRGKGVLVIGSGNIVHNLGRIDWDGENGKPEKWAQEFDEAVKKNLDSGTHNPLINYLKLTKDAATAVPTNDHYLPMLYVLGLQQKEEKVSYLFEGFQNANLSMRCFKIE